jgi:hypothetical protein
VKLTFGDYSFLGIDNMSVGRCVPLLWESEIRGKKRWSWYIMNVHSKKMCDGMALYFQALWTLKQEAGVNG